MRRSEAQKRQQVRWGINGVDLSQIVVRTEQSLASVQMRVPLDADFPRDKELKEDKTKIKWVEDKEASAERQYSAACLKDFLTLAEPTPEKVLTFVREWGVLTLVEAALPMAEHAEPLAAWSEVSAQMAAVIDLVSFLREREDRNEQEARSAWGKLTKGTTAFPAIDREKPYDKAVQERDEIIKTTLAIMLSAWLDDIGIVPLVGFEGTTPSVGLWLPNKRWSSLYAALVLNLIAVASNPERLFRCGWCGRRSFKTAEERMTRKGLIPRCTDEECRRKSYSSKSIKSNKKARAKLITKGPART